MTTNAGAPPFGAKHAVRWRPVTGSRSPHSLTTRRRPVTCTLLLLPRNLPRQPLLSADTPNGTTASPVSPRLAAPPAPSGNGRVGRRPTAPVPACRRASGSLNAPFSSRSYVDFGSRWLRSLLKGTGDSYPGARLATVATAESATPTGQPFCVQDLEGKGTGGIGFCSNVTAPSASSQRAAPGGKTCFPAGLRPFLAWTDADEAEERATFLPGIEHDLPAGFGIGRGRSLTTAR